MLDGRPRTEVDGAKTATLRAKYEYYSADQTVLNNPH